jgi:hypothetical protein
VACLRQLDRKSGLADRRKIVCESNIVSEPDALIAWLTGLKLELTLIGLEAGPLSQCLFAVTIHNAHA